jgi:hypothetical protein
MSNCIDKDEFFAHYGFCIDQIYRTTKPGRISAVHCMDIPLSNAGCDAMFDLPGRIILEHEKRGFAVSMPSGFSRKSVLSAVGTAA